MPDAQQLRDTFEQQYQLGIPQLDKIHGEFVTLLNDTLTSVDSDFGRHLQRLYEHTQLHFFEEEARMTAFGFDGLQAHQDDHNRILQKLEALSASVAAGDLDSARSWLNKELPNWFDGHTRNMDGAAVAWVLEHSAEGAMI